MHELTRPHPGRMTVDEFLEWQSPGPLGWQLVDGDLAEMAPATEFHGAIQAELIRLLGNHLADGGSACRVVATPGIVPHVRAEMNYRIPDVGITCSPASNGPFITDPVVLAEILSVSNEGQTRANVWAYSTIPSVREILLLRASRMEAELFRRRADGSWPANPDRLGPGAILHLESLGFTVPLAAAYRTTGLQR